MVHRLSLKNGEVRRGADLRSAIEDALNVRSLINGLHSRYDRSVVEQATIAGLWTPDLLNDADAARHGP